ncbi:MAG: phosphoglycerate kinase [Bdellovibrionales bacterium]|nr:phosphoglycerate kinase [Bdellovibrionales bacterium]
MSKTLSGIKSIDDFSLEDKKVFIRVDFNVPMENGRILDETRINAALPTIKYAVEKGAKIVLASHWGRPKSPEDFTQMTLEPVAKRISEILKLEVLFIEEPRSDAPKALLAGLKPSQIIFLENLRFCAGEEENSREFAQKIADYTEIYINDAFGASHRAHASIVALPQLVPQHGLGFLMKKEIAMLDQVRWERQHPFLAILGGAKVSDKIDIIEMLLEQVDTLIVGGAMAYTFLASQNISIGKSRVEVDKIRFAASLMERAQARGKKILLPMDHIVVKNIKQPEEATLTFTPSIQEDFLGVDIGPQSIDLFSKAILNARTIFWNGPMGIFETPQYSQGTFALAQALAENSKATTIVGGGDSAAAAMASGYGDKMTHISTGGGASLEYLQGKKMPGIEALRPAKKSEPV